MDKIVRTTVPEEQRLGFLPAHVGGYYLGFEKALYNALRDFSCGQYEGGYWEYYSLSNGGWYAAMDSDTTYVIEVPTNGYRGAMSADAAGVFVSLMAINHLLWAVVEENEALARELQTAFYALRDYAAEHEEAAAIFGAID